jgi:hypothetical protein
MRIYISGPIAGRPDGNREAFRNTQHFLEGRGHQTVNPHDISHDHLGALCARGKTTDRSEDPHRYGCYLRADILALSQCDAIWPLPHWDQSPGARAEMEFARACSIPILCIGCIDWEDGRNHRHAGS